MSEQPTVDERRDPGAKPNEGAGEGRGAPERQTGGGGSPPQRDEGQQGPQSDRVRQPGGDETMQTTNPPKRAGQ